MRRERHNNLCALVLGLILSVNLPPIPSQTAPPHLDWLSPTAGPIGTRVTAHGTGFTSENNLVLFDGFGAIPHIASSDGTTISFTVPEYLDPYCRYIAPPCQHPQVLVVPKPYRITVQNTQGISGTLSFTVTRALYVPLVVSAGGRRSATSVGADRQVVR